MPLWVCGRLQSAEEWYDSDVIGIDTGITMVMAENARTAFVWDTFMKNPEAQRGMERAGFKYRPRSADTSLASVEFRD